MIPYFISPVTLIIEFQIYRRLPLTKNIFFFFFFFKIYSPEGLYFSSFLHTVQIQITKQVMHGAWIWRGLEHSSSVDWVVFPHISGLPRFGAFCCHHRLRPDTAPCCKFIPLTDTLANHTGVMPVSVRTIVCMPVRHRRDSNSCPHHWH